MKRTVPLIIAGTVGFVLIVSYFIPYTESWGEDAMTWFNILAAIAFVLGAGNLVKMHLKKISDQQAGWGYSAITLAAFFFTLIVGMLKIGVTPSEKYPTNAWAGPYDQAGSAFRWVYDYLFLPLSATMFAMLAFYIASAAFRAFRAKNVEAIALLTTAFIVLLGRTYAGVWLTDWIPEESIGLEADALRLDNVTGTIMNTFNLAGMRAITIGIALGVASTSLKVLLGVDRSYLGSTDD
ncbi:MAG: hypothetical protein DWQ34_00680 [Planctomycetota bacterium]|nr:MAG: hypothetical protein DWQ29_00825 [Planctomycetota bacterium]REJ97886.1 MAG: hypothetical protein DWQ34_00680 [Planctomycetota bacterium]REK25642.1 MAG: hypothetical protein DWQ41_11970 [Planctomycetota bacterium]REK31646.1 MAG: hypothetical protein DWQ45_18715 [Planctomycetota bacterium]